MLIGSPHRTYFSIYFTNSANLCQANSNMDALKITAFKTSQGEKSGRKTTAFME